VLVGLSVERERRGMKKKTGKGMRRTGLKKKKLVAKRSEQYRKNPKRILMEESGSSKRGKKVRDKIRLHREERKSN